MNSSAYFSRNPHFNDEFERRLTSDLDYQLRRGKPSLVRRLVQRFLALALHARRHRAR